MRTPEESYGCDVQYRALVDLIENQLSKATFTPSEVREMAMLACIHFEQRRSTPDFKFLSYSELLLGKSKKIKKTNKENKE